MKHERNMPNQRKPIKSFRDLEVYQNLYKAAILVMKEIIPKLPQDEKYGLKEQLNRACKSPCALIAEGFAKKHLKKSFKKYLDDAIGECNEMITHLSYCRDLYSREVDVKLCDQLIDLYDKSSRQLFNLGKVWKDFT